MTKIEIKWDVLSKFFQITETTPKNLVAWLEKIIKLHGGQLGAKYPCRTTPYKGKWSINSAVENAWDEWATIKLRSLGQIGLFVPHFIPEMDVYDIWRKLRFDETWRNEALTKLKEYYKL